jgi:hypothetical protein
MASQSFTFVVFGESCENGLCMALSLECPVFVLLIENVRLSQKTLVALVRDPTVRARDRQPTVGTRPDAMRFAHNLALMAHQRMATMHNANAGRSTHRAIVFAVNARLRDANRTRNGGLLVGRGRGKHRQARKGKRRLSRRLPSRGCMRRR